MPMVSGKKIPPASNYLFKGSRIDHTLIFLSPASTTSVYYWTFRNLKNYQKVFKHFCVNSNVH